MLTQLTVHTELLRFLRSLLLGLPCGLLFDMLRTLRVLLPHHPAAVFLEDAAYAFFCCFAVQCYAWSFCGGVFRWMYAAGGLLGLTVYMLTAGRVWARILLRLRRAACAIRQKIRRMFVGNHKNPENLKNLDENS